MTVYYPPLDQEYATPMPSTPYDQVKTPLLPLLGNLSHEQMVQAVLKAIIGEATAVDFYGRLIKEAPNELQRSFIEDAWKDEQKHLHAFTKLYVYLTGQMPQYRIQPVRYKNYREGLLYAMKDELEAHSYYAEMTLSTTDQLIKDTFSYAMNDEIEHATTFSFSYQEV
jgi:rubrerythrin